jgi:hypothetical protein
VQVAFLEAPLRGEGGAFRAEGAPFGREGGGFAAEGLATPGQFDARRAEHR